jgi:hypothetical protein
MNYTNHVLNIPGFPGLYNNPSLYTYKVQPWNTYNVRTPASTQHHPVAASVIYSVQ